MVDPTPKDEEEQLIINDQLLLTLLSNTEDKTTIVQELISAGASVNYAYPQYKNNTPLHIAINKADEEVVKVLLNNGAVVNKTNDLNKTPLEFADDLGHKGNNIKQMLIEKGAVFRTDTASIPTEKAILHNNNTKRSIDKAPTFPKRSGTSGAGGQLYESKMLCLVFHRALHIDDITEFYLGSNINGIGDLDDICLKYKLRKGEVEKTVYLFVQAKHRDDPKKGRLTIGDLKSISGDFSYVKYFNSYMKIIKAITPNSNDVFFKADINNVECNYVLYTSAEHAMDGKIKPVDKGPIRISERINDLIATGENKDVFRYNYDNKDIEFLSNVIIKEDLKLLGKKLLNFHVNNNTKDMMTDDLMKKYHVVLAKSVVEVTSDTNAAVAVFRDSFFDSNDEILCTLKESLYTEIIKRNTLTNEEVISYLNQLIHHQSEFTISNLINIIVFDEKSQELRFADNKSIINIVGYQNIKRYKDDLQNIIVTSASVKKVFDKTCKKKLLSIKMLVPNSFGNKDMIINKPSRIGFIIEKFLPIIKEAKFDGKIKKKVIELNDRTDKRILGISGGLGSAVGNVFELDKHTKLLMFSNNNLLGYAKQFMTELSLKLPANDLSQYRFRVNISEFPRISFHGTEYDKSLARDFLDRLYIYANQSRESKVGEIIISEIDKNYNKDKRVKENLFRIHSHAIFAKFHDDMQKWWLTTKQVYYLTKNSDMFESAKMVVQSPLLTVHNVMNINSFKQSSVEFPKEIVEKLVLNETRHTKIVNIVTKSVILSGIKVWQYLKEGDFAFVDFDYVSELPSSDYNRLMTELKETNLKTLIILNEKFSDKLIQMVRSKLNDQDHCKIVIISDEIVSKELTQYFTEVESVTIRENRIDLADMTAESRKKVLSQTKVTFQGEKISLDNLINEKPKFVSDEILNKLLKDQNIEVGLDINNQKYNNVKHKYLDRELRRGEEVFEVQTLLDLDAPVVVTGLQRTGKHTFLTHIALQTKKIKPSLWIPVINLGDHKPQYLKWKKDKSVIDLNEAVAFVCKASLKNIGRTKIEIEVTNGVAVLTNRDEILNGLVLFELELFIESLNNRNIVFLFYGFDDICHHFSTEVIYLLTQLTCLEQSVWMTSDPYNNHLGDTFGVPYSLEPLRTIQQEGWLARLFATGMKLEKNISELSNYQFELIDKVFGSVPGVMKHIMNMDITNNYGIGIIINIYNYIIYYVLKRDITEMTSFLYKYTSLDEYLGTSQHPSQTCTPLHLYIIENYLHFRAMFKGHVLSIEQSLTCSEHERKLRLLKTIPFFYKSLLEANLKQLYTEAQITDEVMEEKFKEERANLIDIGKKLALFTIYKESDIAQTMSSEDIRDITNMITKGETSQDMFEIAGHVINNAPRIAHFKLAEYFAVDYLTDVMKAFSKGSFNDLNEHRALWDSILNIMLYNSSKHIRRKCYYKLDIDPKIVTDSENSSKIIFEMVTEQSSDRNRPGEGSSERNGRPERDLDESIGGPDRDLGQSSGRPESSGESSSGPEIPVNKGLKNISSLMLKTIDSSISDDALSIMVKTVNVVASVTRCVAKKDKVTDLIVDAMEHVTEEKCREVLTSDSTAELPIKLMDAVAKSEDVKVTVALVKDKLASVNVDKVLRVVELGGISIGLSIQGLASMFTKPGTSPTINEVLD